MAGAENRPPDPPDPGNARQQFPLLSGKGNHNESTSSKATFNRYLEIDFGQMDRRDLNPYKLKNEVEEKINGKLVEFTGGSRNKIIVQTKNADQTRKCLEISSLNQTKCEVKLHPRFNQCQGLIYLRECDFDDTQDLEHYLAKNYNVGDLTRADFIKSRRAGVNAFILTFNQETLPYSVYIPGEISDTVVYKFGSKPMMCSYCLAYGHTRKKCKKETPRCRRCAEGGHMETDCTASTQKCFHCSEDHKAGDKMCKIHDREQQILDLVTEKKLTFQRARQILNDKPSQRMHVEKIHKFPTFFDCKLPPGIKRKLNPFAVEKSVQQHTGKKPVSCRGKPGERNKDTYIIQVSTEEESCQMSTFNKILNYDVITTVDETSNVVKGLIFLHGFKMLNDSDHYVQSLKAENNIAEVEEANWISKKNGSTPMILTFRGEMPEYLDIPGESIRTRVIEYRRQPNLCKKCLTYGHSKTNCREEARCLTCTSKEHNTENCIASPKCLHCHKSHKTGYKDCREHQYEQELLFIQSRSRVSRIQARIIFEENNPNFRKLNYAEALITKDAKTSEANSRPSTSNTNHPNPATDHKSYSNSSTANRLPKLVEYEDDDPLPQDPQTTDNNLRKKRSITPENTPNTTKIAKVNSKESSVSSTISLTSSQQKTDNTHKSGSRKTEHNSAQVKKDDRSRERSSQRSPKNSRERGSGHKEQHRRK